MRLELAIASNNPLPDERRDYWFGLINPFEACIARWLLVASVRHLL